MNIDQKFGLFTIPKHLIIYSSKYFFAFTPPNPILPGRKLYY